MRPARSDRIVWLLAGALALRLALFGCATSHPERLLTEEDSVEYERIARNLADGHGFSQAAHAPYHADLRRTPVYPAMLAVVFLAPGAGVRAAALAGIALSTLTVLATFRLGILLAGRAAAQWAGLLLATDLTSAAYSTQVLTEPLFTLLLILSFLPLLARRRSSAADAVAAGILSGLAALCRPIAILSFAALAPSCLFRAASARQAVRLLLVAATMAGLIVGAWMVRNYRAAGTATVSSVVATNMYFHRAAYIEAYVHHRPVEDLRDEWEREFQQRSSSWTEAERVGWMNEHGRDVVLAHPLLYALVALRGAARMLTPDHLVVSSLLGGEATPAFRALHAAAWAQIAIVYVFAVVGIARLWRVSPLRVAVPLAPIAYFLAVGGPEMYPRFRVPLMPFVCVLAGAGIALDEPGPSA
ncbi:MAG TPA: hypothetical protein VF921_17740 [Vicinamibacterales bacterium]